MKLELTKRQAKIGLAHLTLVVISLAISTGFAFVNWRIAFPIMIAEIAVIIILIFSALDYFDVIQFRKTVIRKTKCCVCGRVSKSEYDKESLIKLESFKSKKEGDSEKKTTKTEEVPEKPLEGIIVSGKVICTDCMGKIKKYG